MPPVRSIGHPRAASSGRVRAVLFDRDGTLVHDVPYNGDPALVAPVDTARAAVDRVRAAGLGVGVVTNQSAIATGRLTADQVRRVNERVDALLGPFDVWEVCPHGPADGCSCRKPASGMVLSAARRLGVAAADVVVIGDIGADVGAARAAGARGILVPTRHTRAEEVRDATEVAADLLAAVALALGTDAPGADGTGRDATDMPAAATDRDAPIPDGTGVPAAGGTDRGGTGR